MENDRTNSSAARIGAALANIARGAAGGGLHGAAIGAVQSLFPQLLKLVGVILVIVLLPFLIIASLPNLLFGFSSSADTQIQEVNQRAADLAAVYGQLDQQLQARILEIVGLAGAASGGYDELEINKELDNTNLYWFIAIASVSSQQDLHTMDSATIADLVSRRLSWNWNLFSRTEGEGEDQVTIHTLKVGIRDLSPEELMEDLGFTNGQKLWAGLLYSTMMDDQTLSPGAAGGDMAGIDTSDFVFTNVTTPVVYYSQLDKRWCNLLYGKSGTIGDAGCGPTSLAIAVASLIDSSVTPVDTANWAVQSGHRCEGNGSYHSIIPAGAQHYGLQVEGLGRSGEKLVQALSEGKLVVALMSKGHFTNGGHFIVLRGITEDGKILVADCASTKRSNQEWALSIFIQEARRNASSGGPFWAVWR